MIAVLLLLAALPANPASSAESAATPAAAAMDGPWPVQLHRAMSRLGQAEWRLRRAARAICPRRSGATGMVLDYIAAYPAAHRPAVTAATGMGEWPQVVSVAPESPAAAAGLQPGDQILAVNGETVATLLAQAPDRALFADFLSVRLDASPPGKPITLDIRRGHTSQAVTLVPAEACATQFLLKPDRSVDAYSDGYRLVITTGLMDRTINDDELALIAGHELGHVVNADGRAAGLAIRQRMEADADLLGAAIMECAGYDRLGSLAYWIRYRARDKLGFLRAPTHGSIKTRVAQMTALPPVTCPLLPGHAPGLRAGSTKGAEHVSR